jgi:cobalt/nickel transport system permease protein
MHIPDGYLGPQTYVTLSAVLVPIWAAAARRVQRVLKARQVPLMALGAAFSFVVMMFNIPVIGGSTGHAVGAALVAILLGPWAACLSVSIALVIQALLFGDGGITAIGANCFNMAVVMPFVGYHVYRRWAGDAPSPQRRTVAAGVAGYLSILAGATLTGIEFGLQPLLAHTDAGQPLYCPYPLSVAVPAMVIEHLLFFGWVEALATAGIVAALGRQDSALLEMKPASRPVGWLWVGLGILILLSPLGLLADGTAWGEWSSEQVGGMVGFVPVGMARLGGAWTALLPDYAPPFIRQPMVGYVVAALVGSGVIVALTWLIGVALVRRRRAP